MKEGKYAKTLAKIDSGHGSFSYARYAEKFFNQSYRDLYGDAMLVAAGNQQKHLSLSFAIKA